VKLFQVIPGRGYRTWNVFNAWGNSTDIAILHLGLDGTCGDVETVEWKSLRLRALPPPQGETVLAFGYREGKIDVEEDTDGIHHSILTDKGTTSIGQVGQVFPERRDGSMLTFPCFEVHARFDHKMSGGLVIDEEGALCGLICSGMDVEPDMPPLSYATTLWPMMTTPISADRGDSYPRGVEYPVIDLALDRIIEVVGLDKLDPRVFPGRVLHQ
jgi:hypothetical protein